MKKLFFIIFSSFIALHLSAQLSMPAFFSDHMVLQRNKPIILWGHAKAKSKVNILLFKQTSTTTADKSGNWKTTLKPMAAGGPYTLMVKSAKQTLKVSDILIGEVWLCSGQSNMELHLSQAKDANIEIADSKNYPLIRSFTVDRKMSPTPCNDVQGSWQVSSEKVSGKFTAVGYFFARELYKKLNVPIGFINASWGGTNIQTWISQDEISKNPAYKNKALDTKSVYEYIKQFDINKAEFLKNVKDEIGEPQKWYAENMNTNDWKSIHVPAIWKEKELASINGVVWLTYKFNIPASYLGAEGQLSLGPINDDDVTWINGNEVGKTAGFTAERYYTIPAEYLKEENVVTVKVIDYHLDGGIYGTDDQLFLHIRGHKIPLVGEWKYKVSYSSTFDDYKTSLNPNLYPSLLYNGMINALVGLPMRGAIWYQGESNCGKPIEYASLFPTLINNWRDKWKEQFPFYWVQLPNFMAPKKEPVESNWAILRQSQTKTLSLAHTGQAVTIDLGEADNIHPHNKQDVGKRLALLALHNDYNYESLGFSGPTYRSIERVGNHLVVTLDVNGPQLINTNKYNYVCGLAIAGADGKYQWAQAKIDGNKIIVWNDSVSEPISVRYAWADNPDDIGIYNSYGLPACPFQASIK